MRGRAGRARGGRRRLALLAALGVAVALPARAEPGTEPLPLAERARAVLEAHCKDCQDLRRNGDRLDLDTVADDPRLVLPRRPDASRIYQHLLRDQAAGAGAGEASPAPTPTEVETVRDWIESLPARDEPCRDRPALAAGAPQALFDAWAKARDAGEVADARILSLAHLWNACVPDGRLQEFREAAAKLVAALARRREAPALETLGPEGAVLVVRLSRIALKAADWERLDAHVPRPSGKPVAMPADWLAAYVLAGPGDASGTVDPAFDVKFDAASQRAVESLAHAWTRDVDLVRAAAERGVVPRTLAETLSAVGGEFLHPARRLIHGTLPRSAWQRLSRALDGEAPPGSADRGTVVSDSEIDVLLWTDKPVYRPRDLVTIHVSVSKACHLTLIDVDRNGKAVVLFPNELEPDNLIAPSVAVGVPGRDAGYQLRFDHSGAEQIVAICQRKQRRPPGIAYDYERQRFAILGDWRTFLRTIPERRKKIAEREAAEIARRKRRGRKPPDEAPPAIGAEDPVAIEGRAAITVSIEPGGT